MNLEQLRLFACVAEYGSLTKAAVALDSQQSVVSRQLSSLETELAAALLSHRPWVTLTELGTTLLPRAQRLLRDIEDLAQDMKAHADVPAATSALASCRRSPILWSTSSIVRLASATPGQTAPVRGSNDNCRMGRLGRVDIALLYRYESIDSASERVLARPMPIWSDRPATASLASPPLRSASSRTCRWSYRAHRTPAQLARSVCASRGISLTIAMEADSLPIQKSIVADGGLYTIIGRQAVTREIDTGLLQASESSILRSNARRSCWRQRSVVTPSRHAPSPA